MANSLAGGGHRHFSRHSLFPRFLVTYLLVLFVPLFALTVFQYTFSFRALKDRLLDEKRQGLERSAELVEQQFNQLRRIVLRMSFSSDFRPFDFDALPYRGYALVRAIGEYVYEDTFSEEIFVHFDDDRYVYTSYNAQRVDEFARDYLASTGLFDRVTAAHAGDAFYANGTQIVLVCPFPSGLPHVSYGRIMFFFDRSLLLTFFSDHQTLYSIRDQQNRPIFVSDDSFPERPDDVILTYQSSGRLVFENRIPAGRLSGDLLHYRNAYLIAVVLVLVVSFPLVYFVAASQFNPIRRLTQFVRSATGGRTEESSCHPGNELQRIHDDIDDYVHKTSPAVKTQLVYDLLNGKIENTERIYERSKEMALRWKAEMHTVVVAAGHEAAFKGPDCHAAIEARIRRAPDYAIEEALIHESPHDNRLVFIIGFNATLNRNDVELLLGEGSHLLCGCGSPKRSPEQLNAAYAEAQRAIEYCRLQGSTRVVFFDEIGGKPSVDPREVLVSLNDALDSRDLDGVKRSFLHLQQMVQENSFSLFDIKMVYYELLNTAVRINEKWRYPDTFQIENIDSIDEVVALIRRIAAAAIDEQQSVEDVPEFVSRLRKFIDENYTDCQISLKLLEDEFGYSQPYISRSFKKYVGINISAYVTSLRIARAKELLRNSGLPVHDIVAGTGYTDTSSFSRAFRRSEGVSPGEYRSRHGRGLAGRRAGVS